MDQLKVGESLLLVAASGKPAVVTRNEHGVTVEVAGERREIALPDAETLHLHHHALDGRDVKLLHLDHKHARDTDRQVRKIVIVHHGDDAADALSEAEVDALVAEAQTEAGIGRADDGEPSSSSAVSKNRIATPRRTERLRSTIAAEPSGGTHARHPVPT